MCIVGLCHYIVLYIYTPSPHIPSSWVLISSVSAPVSARGRKPAMMAAEMIWSGLESILSTE